MIEEISGRGSGQVALDFFKRRFIMQRCREFISFFLLTHMKRVFIPFSNPFNFVRFAEIHSSFLLCPFFFFKVCGILCVNKSFCTADYHNPLIVALPSHPVSEVTEIMLAYPQNVTQLSPWLRALRNTASSEGTIFQTPRTEGDVCWCKASSSISILEVWSLCHDVCRRYRRSAAVGEIKQ